MDVVVKVEIVECWKKWNWLGGSKILINSCRGVNIRLEVFQFCDCFVGSNSVLISIDICVPYSFEKRKIYKGTRLNGVGTV